ncbi:hypothetical protein [Undibacterium sp. Ji49W]|uniref:hypothetical protein n=1 Tax=Undibacterium sp. Ji49W TaxID=3413040 RepID=UPI003BF1767A
MSDIGFSADKIVIIDLTSDSELQTGRAIEENVVDFISEEQSRLVCEREKCKSEQDFRAVISRIKTDLIVKDQIPLIHIEGHGSKDSLFFPDHSSIAWSTVFELLREINILSKNNLFFACGACESAYALKGASITKASPVFGLLAPEKVVRAGDVADGFIAFYKSLIKNGSLNTASNALASATNAKNFAFIFSYYLFKNAVSAHKAKHRTGRGKQERLEEVLSEAVDKIGSDVNGLRKQLKSILPAVERQKLLEFYQIFMMCDLYPENAERFKFDELDFEAGVSDN